MESAFNERGVAVTRNSLSAGGQVFALRDVLGVEVVTIRRNRIVPAGISIAGLIAAVAGGAAGSSVTLVVGVMLIVVGYLTWITQDVTHRLVLDTPSGKREALSSVDRAFVEQVARAVRDARDASAA